MNGFVKVNKNLCVVSDNFVNKYDQLYLKINNHNLIYTNQPYKYTYNLHFSVNFIFTLIY